jgi:hypothetical protein
MIGQKIANLKNGQRPDSLALQINKASAVTQTQAAELVGSTPEAISRARTISEWAPETAKKV